MTCVQYIKASFIKGISCGSLSFPSPAMFRIALISYLVIICESDEFQKYSSHRDFAAKLSQSVLEAEHFPFFSLGMCKGKRDPHTLAKVAWWICSNNVLNNYCSKEMIN